MSIKRTCEVIYYIKNDGTELKIEAVGDDIRLYDETVAMYIPKIMLKEIIEVLQDYKTDLLLQDNVE